MRKRFRVLLAERDMTLQELSERTGLHISSLSDIRSGKSSPRVATLERIATALGVQVRDFFEE